MVWALVMSWYTCGKQLDVERIGHNAWTNPLIFFFFCTMGWHSWEVVGTRRWRLVAEWTIWDVPGKMSLVPCAFLSVSQLLWSERLCGNSPCQSVCPTVGSKFWGQSQTETSKSLSRNVPFCLQVSALRCLSRQHKSSTLVYPFFSYNLKLYYCLTLSREASVWKKKKRTKKERKKKKRTHKLTFPSVAVHSYMIRSCNWTHSTLWLQDIENSPSNHPRDFLPTG